MGFFSGLVKAAVGVVITPVAVVADAVALPFEGFNKEPFNRTEKVLKQVGKDVDKAFEDSDIF